MAPHVIRPLRFVLPPKPGAALAADAAPRAVALRLARRAQASCRPRALSISRIIAVGQPLKRSFRYGFEYSDCWVDDARLVVLNAVDAAERGAVIRTRTADARRAPRGMAAGAQRRGRREVATARVLVNAAGPWVGQVADTMLRTPLRRRCGSSKAATSSCARRFEHDRAYIFQAADGRVVFALPFATRLHADRHHRREFRRRLNAPAPDAARDHLSLRRGERLFPRRGHARRTGLGLRRRARALRRRRRQAARTSRAITC